MSAAKKPTAKAPKSSVDSTMTTMENLRLEDDISESELSLFQSTKAYKHLNKLQLSSLNKLLCKSEFSHDSEISSYYEKSMCEDELEYSSDKDAIIKKIIFAMECEAHKMLQDLAIPKSKNKRPTLTTKEKNQFNLESKTKWELLIILEYFRIDMKLFSLNNKECDLIYKIEQYLLNAKKETLHADTHLFSLKKFIDVIGHDILNIKSDPNIELIIDGDCYFHNPNNPAAHAGSRSTIRRIFHQCSAPGVKTVPVAFSANNPAVQLNANTLIFETFATMAGVLVFMETMQTGGLAAGLRGNNWRVACKIRRYKANGNPNPWISVTI